MIKKQHILLIALLLPGLLLSGCQIFPYVYTSVTPTLTETILPTHTEQVIPTMAPISTTPQETEAGDNATPTPIFSFDLQGGNPFTLPNFTHPEAGCDWLGVAGQVFDDQGNEVAGLTILVGSVADNAFETLSTQTGEAQAYGLGGYEIIIAGHVFNSTETYWIQIFDQEGAPLSERVFFDTFEDCEQNLILINFIPLDLHGTSKSVPSPDATPTLEAYP